MPGPFGLTIWILCTLLEASVVVCAVLRKSFRRYLFINLYMAAAFLVSLGRFQILARFGLTSNEYAYYYFYSDALLTIGLYFAITSLYAHIMEELRAEKYVRLGAVLLLGATAWFSYQVIQQSSHKLLTHFAFELSQNLFFVGLVLTYLLWAVILKMRETRTRLIQLVLSLGVYFSLLSASYALRNLYPNLQDAWAYLPPLFGCLLPLAWFYAFWRVPEEARLAPSRLAVPR